MNNNGFFGWIREGVKRSVLLGVSDALDAIGTIDGEETYHPTIVKALQANPSNGATSTRTPRKRLGKSLRDIHPNAPQPAQAKPIAEASDAPTDES